MNSVHRVVGIPYPVHHSSWSTLLWAVHPRSTNYPVRVMLESTLDYPVVFSAARLFSWNWRISSMWTLCEPSFLLWPRSSLLLFSLLTPVAVWSQLGISPAASCIVLNFSKRCCCLALCSLEFVHFLIYRLSRSLRLFLVEIALFSAQLVVFRTLALQAGFLL